MRRFALWLGPAELEPPIDVYWARASDLATENGEWRGAAFFVYEQSGWTVFEDLSGSYLSSKTGEDWLRLADGDELVFAGYNDSFPYAELVVVRQGQVVREFHDDEQSPAENIDRGHLAFEDTAPIKSWIEAASFVDADNLAVGPDVGTLWMFHGPV